MGSTVLETQESRTPARSSLRLRSDWEFWSVLAGLTGIYVAALFFEGQRFVWFDELCTFDIARAGSLRQLWQWVLKYDNNPPTVYLLSRWSMEIFGPTAFGLRLPSMLAFYLGSVAMLLYLRRKVGTAVGAFAVLMLWSSATFYYATEARVYALVFMSFSFLLLSWDTATRQEHRTLALWGVAFFNALLLVSHVFASLCLMAVLLAEAVRYLRRRQPDYPLYAALVLPMGAMLVYIPLIRVYHGLILWPQFHASFLMAGRFYYHAMDSVARALFVVALAAVVLLPSSKNRRTPTPSFAAEDWALFICVLLNPLFLNLLLMHRQGDFFDRYTLVSDVMIYGVLAVLFAVRLRFRKITAYAAALVMLFLMVHMVQRNWVKRPRQLDPSTFRSLRPELPIVISNGATFVEMSQHESPAVVQRLYYIKDRSAALKYDHTNYYYDFEALDDMKSAGFPFAGHVEPYSEFVAHHRQFIIYADPFEWLPLKLREDGAQFTLLMAFLNEIPYPPDSLLHPPPPPPEMLMGSPRISYATPYVEQASPYIARHVFLVTMPPR